MALIKCKECSKELSKMAKKCPNCGATTEYGKQASKKLIIVLTLIIVIVIGAIIFDRSAILKSCNYGDEKQGGTCVAKHYSEAQSKYVCLDNYYLEDGKCYSSRYTGAIGPLPHKEYYCNSGYLEEYISVKRCVVETTYNAYYKFSFGEE